MDNIMDNFKCSRITHKELVEKAINQIEFDTKFHIYNIEFTDTYFIFDGDKDSICTFKIKEIPRIFICILAYR